METLLSCGAETLSARSDCFLEGRSAWILDVSYSNYPGYLMFC